MAYYIDSELIDKYIYGQLKNLFDSRSSSLYLKYGRLYYYKFIDIPICIRLKGGFVFWEDYPEDIDKMIIKTLKNKLKGKKVLYLKGNIIQEVIDKNMKSLTEVLIKIMGKNI